MSQVMLKGVNDWEGMLSRAKMLKDAEGYKKIFLSPDSMEKQAKKD
jgi:hypothetical protein